MGKASRKLKKKQQQEEAAGRQTEAKELEQKLQDEIEQEAYSDALDTLAKLAEKQAVSVQSMYAGAYAYFMLGDYDRAATWIDNTLRFAPGHIAARILLARLCILQEKIDAGLSIFDLLADKFLPGMSDEEKDEVESLSGFYGRNEPERIKNEYPHLAKFLHLDEEKKTAPEMAVRVTEVKPDSAPQTEEKIPEAPKTAPESSGKSALDVLRSLKQKIDARVHGGSEEANHKEASVPVVTAAPAETSVPVPTGTDEAQKKLREVLDGSHSIAEKVRLLNSFAGGYYAQDNLAAAELFLKEALKLDETDDGLLRNLAVLLAEKGEKTKAFEAAARMRQTDFLLIQAIREM